MRTVLPLLLFLCLTLANISYAQEKRSLDDQLRSYLHKDYFTLNVLVQSEGRFSFQDDNFQGGRSFSVPNARISIKGSVDGGFFLSGIC